MSELYPTDAELNDLSGTTDQEQEVLYIPTGQSPYHTSFYKMVFRLLNVCRRAGDLRVYKDGDLTYGVRAGYFLNGDAMVTYAGSTENALTNNADNYIYLTAAGTLTINTTGFPVPSVTPHIPLAKVTTSAGNYSINDGDIVDYRGLSLFGVCGASTGSLNLLDWQDSVKDELDFTSAEPSGPTLGDRYKNTGTGTSSETSQSVTANYLYEWNATSWTPIAPSEGACCMVEDRNMLIGYNGSSWVDIGTFALLTEAQTFFASTDISAAEAETLTDGSNADAKHVHTADSGLSDLTATAAEINAVCDDCTATAAEITAACDGFSGSAANLTEASTFFGSTDISAAEAETLTDGSNADAKHVHTADSGLSDLTATAAEINAVCDDCTATAAEITAVCDACTATAAEISMLAKRVAIKAWGYVDFAGRPADGDLLTINGRKYEYDSDASFPDSAGDVQIDANAAGSVDDDITACAAAINGDGSATVTAVADTTDDILWLYAATAGAAGNSLTLVSGLTNTTASGATLADGADAGIAAVVPIRHTITAQEATEGKLRFDTGLTSIENIQCNYEDAGVIASLSLSTVAVAGGIVTITEGGVAWAANDVLNLLIVGTE